LVRREVLAMARSNPKKRSASATAEAIKALVRFQTRLSKAFFQEPDCSRTAESERERYAAALVVVALFVGGRIGSRFSELASAIADLNTGTVHPLLAGVRVHNRRADTSQMWRARARVALGLEALLRSGLSRTEAAAKVATEFPSIARLAGPRAKNSTLRTIVFGWRKELKAGRVKNFEAGELFSEGIKEIDRLATLKGHRIRKFAMSQLTQAAELSGVLSPGC
jgi:hypothetical protein